MHVDGVDFTTLEPAWLAIAMFVLIPGVYAALLTVVAEQWLAPGGGFMTAPAWLALAPLVLWTPLLPFLGRAARRHGGARGGASYARGRVLLSHPPGRGCSARRWRSCSPSPWPVWSATPPSCSDRSVTQVTRVTPVFPRVRGQAALRTYG